MINPSISRVDPRRWRRRRRPARGSGLVGLKDGVETVGGTIALQSSVGAGTSVEVELPLRD
jgi:signal transduction histidine kinase